MHCAGDRICRCPVGLDQHGIRVSKGQTVVFRCEGAWRLPSRRKRKMARCRTGGKGIIPEKWFTGPGNSKRNCPAHPSGLFWDGGFEGLPIGSQGKVVMPADGALYLVINDYPFYRHDNRGGLTVSIYNE